MEDTMATPPLGTQCQGIIQSWLNRRKFGFILTNFGTVFLHRAEWLESSILPSQGDLVLFFLGKDQRRNNLIAISCKTLQYSINDAFCHASGTNKLVENASSSAPAVMYLATECEHSNKRLITHPLIATIPHKSIQSEPVKKAITASIIQADSPPALPNFNATSASSESSYLEPSHETLEHMQCKSKLQFHKSMTLYADDDDTSENAMRSVRIAYQYSMDTFLNRQIKFLCTDLISNTRKDAGLHAEMIISNNTEAYEYIMQLSDELTSSILLNTHKLLVKGLLETAGQYREKKEAHCGHVYFIPAKEVKSAVMLFIDTLNNVLLPRLDLSPQAKAAWASYNLCVIHPFDDSNGRLSRLLGNWVLKKCGIPFPISLCGSSELRTKYIHAFRRPDEHSLNASQDLCTFISERLYHAWTDFNKLYSSNLREAMVDKKEEEVKIEQAVRLARQDLRSSPCMICFDELCDISMLCCGKPVHIKCINRWLVTCIRTYLPRQCPNCRHSPPDQETGAAGDVLMELIHGHDQGQPVQSDVAYSTGSVDDDMTPVFDYMHDDNDEHTTVSVSENVSVDFSADTYPSLHSRHDEQASHEHTHPNHFYSGSGEEYFQDRESTDYSYVHIAPPMHSSPAYGEDGTGDILYDDTELDTVVDTPHSADENDNDSGDVNNMGHFVGIDDETETDSISSDALEAWLSNPEHRPQSHRTWNFTGEEMEMDMLRHTRHARDMEEVMGAEDGSTTLSDSILRSGDDDTVNSFSSPPSLSDADRRCRFCANLPARECDNNCCGRCCRGLREDGIGCYCARHEC